MAFKGGNSESSSTEMNIISKGTFIDGQVKTESSLQIHGKVKGSIRCNNMLRVGESGQIEGDVEANNANIGGKIKGKLIVKEKLVLESKSSLVGELKAAKLVIEEGAVFDGTSDMGVEKSKQSSAPPPSGPPKSDVSK